VVLDVHDLVPEAYALRYGLPLEHPLVRLTRWAQRGCGRFADHVLTAGEPFRRKLIENGLPADRVTSVMNSPDPRLFQPRPWRPRRGPEFRLSYHGTLNEYTDLSVVLRAMQSLGTTIPGLAFHVYGRGRALGGLRALAAALGLQGRVVFHGERPLDEMPAAVAAADLGVVPQRPAAFTDLNYPTKAFEYIASGVPALVTRSPALEALFGEIAGMYFRIDDAAGLAGLIHQAFAAPEAARALLARQQAACAQAAWAVERQRYLDVMRRLAASAAALARRA
jgi:glycosyltransferase involved in cell wall biosynthesis